MDLSQKYADTNRLFYTSNHVKAADVAETGEFTGHAAVFGNVDQGGDLIVEGAFAETLRAKEFKVVTLWNHIASEPIGHPHEMMEDKIGLFVRGVLNQEVQRGREARALLKAEDIEGMSIGFKVRKGGAEFDEDTGVFKLLSLILREFSIVSFPMNVLATMTGIKAERGSIQTVRQFEQFLLDTTNFTKRQAASVASHGFNTGSGTGGDLQFDKALEALKGLNTPTTLRFSLEV